MAKRRPTTERKGKAASDVGKSAYTSTASESRAEDEYGDDARRAQTATSALGLSGVELNARVARKAYDLFERRGRSEGHDVEDWLEAERLVREELLQQNEAVAS